MRNVTKYLSMLMVVLSILVFASQGRAQTTLLTEGFNTATPGGTVPPAGWGIDIVSGGNCTYFVTAGTWPTIAPFEGLLLVDFESFTYSGYVDRLKRTTPIVTTGYSNITVDFEWYTDNGYSGDLGEGVQVQWSTNGSTWTNAGAFVQRYNAVNQWNLETIALPVGASNQATLYVGLQFTSQYGDDCHLDLLHVKGIQPGTLTGTVSDCSTLLHLANVNVYVGSAGNWIGPAVTNAAGVYTLPGIPPGLQSVSAVKAGYITYAGTTTIIANSTVTDNFCMPLPGILTGIVTNCANGNPIIGALVSWGTSSTYTVAGGLYSMTIWSAGANPVIASKDGWAPITTTPVTVTVPSPPVTTYNFCLNEATPPPGTPFLAALNAGQTAVNLSWGLPVNDYDLIYDNGIETNFGIYATGNLLNQNAVKFTPLMYPTIVKGFFINIGQASDYAIGANPNSPVQMDIYSEVGGLPGVSLSTTTITPVGFGWTRANFATPVTITSGDFFIVMSQIGTSLVSPGIAIDTTNYQMRSYSKQGVIGWLPGPGNYMIRAYVNGSGGPLLMTNKEAKLITAAPIQDMIYKYTPSTVTGTEGNPKVYPETGLSPDMLVGYQVWRLLQGQEATPALWTSIGTTTNLNTVDNSWPSLPCDPYRWGVEAQYSLNRWSTATFSNAVGKCWTCTVIVNVTLSCDSVTTAGTVITFSNLGGMVPDTIYSYTMTASGTHTFTNFWKGNYNLTVYKFGFAPNIQTPLSIMGDMTINVSLLENKYAPTNIHVHDRDALCQFGPLVNWNRPNSTVYLLNENFSSGFGTNGWVVDAGSNWQINAGLGNPAPCAEWYYYPIQSNYSQSLTSKNIVGVSSPLLQLQYDITMSANGTTTLEQMAVEIWNGSTWHSVGNYDNSSGASMPWTTETVNITNIAPNSGFKVRFRANGVDSDWILYWGIDNVKISASTGLKKDPCIIGYDVYLNNVLSGYAADTTYVIPNAQVVYGTSYLVCAAAIYGSGYSAQDCTTWTDKFLCPPDTINAIALDCSALVTWHKPNCGGCTLKNYTYDGGTYWNAQAINPGYTIYQGNYFPLPGTAQGVIKSFDAWFSQYSNWTTQATTLYIYNAAQVLIGTSAPFMNGPAAVWPSGTWINIPINSISYTGGFYGMIDFTCTAVKNGIGMDGVTVQPGYPQGLGYAWQGGTFTPATTMFGEAAPETFAERVNVCYSSTKDAPITTIDPSQVPPLNTIPVPGAAVGLGPNEGVAVVEPPAYNSPEAPTAAPTLLGYNIFRNGGLTPIAYLPYPDTLQYYDYNLNPSTYTYTVDAKYNVAPFNPPSLTDTSMRAHPSATVQIACGYPLPFFEPWDQDSFTYQQWTFSPNQGHWSLTTAIGDPLPCADFTWQPVITNYTTSLVTPSINASAWTCADIWCDFDLKLIDLHATGSEKMDIDLFVNGPWSNKAEFADSGSYDWSLKHVSINAAMGKAFMVRFRANGANSGNILHWYVDNIHIYGVCRPPTLLVGRENQFTTTLTWHSPKCPTSCTLMTYTYDNGGPYWNAQAINPGYTIYQGNYFPLSSSASGVIKSFDAWFSQYSNWTTQSTILYIFNAAQTLVGQSAPFMNGPAATWPSGTWINIPINDFPYTGGFYGMIDFTCTAVMNGIGMDGTTVQPGYSQGLGFGWQGGTFTPATTLFAEAAPETFAERVNVCASSTKDAPITTIDPTNFATGTFVKGAVSSTGPLPAGYKPSINPGFQNFNAPEAPAGSQLMGYNVYRADSTSTVYNMIHHITSSADTTYQDVHPSSTKAPFHWKYFVTAEFQDSLNPAPPYLCEPPSDTITINFPAVGINELTNSISLYPNPANDVVNIVSSNDIKTIEVINYVGQTIYKNNSVNLKITKLDVASYNAGVYFVKITTTEGIKTSKITVTH